MDGGLSMPPAPPPPPPILNTAGGYSGIKLKTRRPNSGGWNLPPLLIPETDDQVVPPLDLPPSPDVETGEGSSGETSGGRLQDSLTSSLLPQPSFASLDFDVDNDPPSPPPPPLPPKLDPLEAEEDYTEEQPLDTLDRLGLAEQPTLETRSFSMMGQRELSERGSSTTSSNVTVINSRAVLLEGLSSVDNELNSPRNLLSGDALSPVTEEESDRERSTLLAAHTIPAGHQFYVPAGIRGGVGNRRANGPPTGQFVVRNHAPIGHGKLAIPKAAIQKAAASHQPAQQQKDHTMVNGILQHPPFYNSGNGPHTSLIHSNEDGANSPIYTTIDKSKPGSYSTVDRSIHDTYAPVDRSAPHSTYATADRSAPLTYATVDRYEPVTYTTVDRSAPASYTTNNQMKSNMYSTVDRSNPSTYIPGTGAQNLNSIIVTASNIPETMTTIPRATHSQPEFTTTMPRHPPKIEAAPTHLPPVLALQTDSPRSEDSYHKISIPSEDHQAKAQQHITVQPVWTQGQASSLTTTELVTVDTHPPKKLSPPVPPKPQSVPPLMVPAGNGYLDSPSPSDFSEYSPRSPPAVVEAIYAVVPSKSAIKGTIPHTTHTGPRLKAVQFAPSTIDNEYTATKLEDVDRQVATAVNHPNVITQVPHPVNNSVSVITVNGESPSNQVVSTPTVRPQQPPTTEIDTLQTANGHVTDSGVSVIAVHVTDNQGNTWTGADHQNDRRDVNDNIHYEIFQEEGFTNPGFGGTLEVPKQLQIVRVTKGDTTPTNAVSVSSQEPLHYQDRGGRGAKHRRNRWCLGVTVGIIILILIGIIAGVIIYFLNTNDSSSTSAR